MNSIIVLLLLSASVASAQSATSKADEGPEIQRSCRVFDGDTARACTPTEAEWFMNNQLREGPNVITTNPPKKKALPKMTLLVASDDKYCYYNNGSFEPKHGSCQNSIEEKPKAACYCFHASTSPQCSLCVGHNCLAVESCPKKAKPKPSVKKKVAPVGDDLGPVDQDHCTHVRADEGCILWDGKKGVEPHKASDGYGCHVLLDPGAKVINADSLIIECRRTR